MEIMTHDDVFLRYSTAEGEGDIWFIHGFGESGLSFVEAFDSPLAEKFNLYVPDFPGFGVSPHRPGAETIVDSTEVLCGLIGDISKDAPIFLVGHSLGGIIGTWTAERLSNKVRGYVSIEGNLTKADTFATSLTKGYEDPNAFHELLSGIATSQIAEDILFRRFLASLTLAHPSALLTWGKSCVEATGVTKAGAEFVALDAKTLYIWGDESIPNMTKDFVFSNEINNREIKGAGHWVMVDKSEECYRAIFEFFSTSV
jgi:pimeloyl-ACP methyl ester carboxylesterase